KSSPRPSWPVSAIIQAVKDPEFEMTPKKPASILRQGRTRRSLLVSRASRRDGRKGPAPSLRARHALTCRRLLVGAAGSQLVVDDLFELRNRLRPRDRPAVNKKRRGSVHTDFLAGGLVAFDLAVVFRLVKARVKLAGIESERLGRRLQIGGRQLALIG